ncbi:hypothetical protein AOX61_30075 [Pseudomonas aeruginosa]|nr:hypothetical protein AOX61_30075 [Pseudomonas aeruginosa]
MFPAKVEHLSTVLVGLLLTLSPKGLNIGPITFGIQLDSLLSTVELEFLMLQSILKLLLRHLLKRSASNLEITHSEVQFDAFVSQGGDFAKLTGDSFKVLTEGQQRRVIRSPFNAAN